MKQKLVLLLIFIFLVGFILVLAMTACDTSTGTTTTSTGSPPSPPGGGSPQGNTEVIDKGGLEKALQRGDNIIVKPTGDNLPLDLGDFAALKRGASIKVTVESNVRVTFSEIPSRVTLTIQSGSSAALSSPAGALQATVKILGKLIIEGTFIVEKDKGVIEGIINISDAGKVILEPSVDVSELVCGLLNFGGFETTMKSASEISRGKLPSKLSMEITKDGEEEVYEIIGPNTIYILYWSYQNLIGGKRYKVRNSKAIPENDW